MRYVWSSNPRWGEMGATRLLLLDTRTRYCRHMFAAALLTTYLCSPKKRGLRAWNNTRTQDSGMERVNYNRAIKHSNSDLVNGRMGEVERTIGRG